MFKLEVGNNCLLSENGFPSLKVSGIDFSNPALTRSKKWKLSDIRIKKKIRIEKGCRGKGRSNEMSWLYAFAELV